MSSPYAACIRNPEIHHSDVTNVSKSVRAATPNAFLNVTSCVTAHA